MKAEDLKKLEKAKRNIEIVADKFQHTLPAIYYISLLTAKDLMTEVLEGKR